MRVENIKTFKYTNSFGRKQQIPTIIVQKRQSELEKEGVTPPYSFFLANLNQKQYLKALYLLKRGVNYEHIQDLTTLEGDKFNQAKELVKNGLFDNFILIIASLEHDNFKKALQYKKDGLENDCLKLFAELNEEELQTAKRLMQKYFYTPLVAGNLAKLSDEQRQTAIEFLKGTEINVACDISKLNTKRQEKCKNYLEQGINQDYIVEISELDEEAEKRLPEIFSLNVGDINITDFAKMSEEEYKRAKELLALGVNPNAIYDIILIEEGAGENDEYSTYRERGYSYSTAASLSALNNFQIEALEKIIEIHPEIRDLFKEEYEVSVIQLQTDDVQEVILTRNIRAENGTRITLVQTFDGYGDKTQSRLETYKDNSTSSIMRNKTGVFKAKYDKYGQIRELTEFIQDFDTHEVIGVIQSKASNLLTGVFEAKYYDIKDIKEGNDGSVDEEIENCVLTEGIPLSSVVQNKDGSISYTEDFQMNDYSIERSYTEKKDENGKIEYSQYSYKICKIEEDDETTIMNISRSFKINQNGTTTNIINGVEYNVKYDDENKKIEINDGKNTKIIDFKTILPIFSQEIIWETIKELQVDALLTISENIKKWQYVEADNSLVDINSNIR
ncbi:MAG: hypothetical protein IJY61_07280 [Candidatus Gastranaerophilales bacterium]|nr:hypothetical protein [Candidatus Gastranaerophilales bacterium]